MNHINWCSLHRSEKDTHLCCLSAAERCNIINHLTTNNSASFVGVSCVFLTLSIQEKLRSSQRSNASNVRRLTLATSKSSKNITPTHRRLTHTSTKYNNLLLYSCMWHGTQRVNTFSEQSSLLSAQKISSYLPITLPPTKLRIR